MIDELKIPIPQNQFVCFPSYEQNPEGVDYVRFENAEGEPILYYEFTEWEDDPQGVMGAILEAIRSGVPESL